MDRGIPTEETLAAMREGDAPVHYLVGTPKGRLTRLEKEFLGLPWQGVRQSVNCQASGRGWRALRPGAQRGPTGEGTRHAPTPAEEAVCVDWPSCRGSRTAGISCCSSSAPPGRRPAGPGAWSTSPCPGPTGNSPPTASHSACGATACAGSAAARAVTCCDPTWSPKIPPGCGTST